MAKYTDKQRLDFLTRKIFVLYHVGGSDWRVGIPPEKPDFGKRFQASPRKAIDYAIDAMKAGSQSGGRKTR